MHRDIKIKIEKGIPLPDCATAKSPLRIAMEKMAVEDSFEIPSDSYATNYFYQCAKHVGINIAIRKVNAKSFRIWRVK